MTTKTSDTIVKPVTIEEVIELYLGDTLISNIVAAKEEQHGQGYVKNTYSFACTNVEKALFEKAIVSNLTVNKNIAAEVTNVACGLDGTKIITVEFLTA